MKCSKCDEELKEGASVCYYCGHCIKGNWLTKIIYNYARRLTLLVALGALIISLLNLHYYIKINKLNVGEGSHKTEIKNGE